MEIIKEKIKKYYKHLIITVVIIFLFVSGIVVNAGSTNNSNYTPIYNTSNNKIKVEILGEVKYPGKYTIPKGTKIKEVFYIVGGLLENSDTSLINLNEELQNNDIIIINKTSHKTKRININTATIEELTKLTGIGQTKAEKIVLYRMTYGSFKTVADLTKVEGISEKTIIEIIDEITLS